MPPLDQSYALPSLPRPRFLELADAPRSLSALSRFPVDQGYIRILWATILFPAILHWPGTAANLGSRKRFIEFHRTAMSGPSYFSGWSSDACLEKVLVTSNVGFSFNCVIYWPWEISRFTYQIRKLKLDFDDLPSDLSLKLPPLYSIPLPNFFFCKILILYHNNSKVLNVTILIL